MIALFSLSFSDDFANAQKKGKKIADKSVSKNDKDGDLGNVSGVTADQLKDYLSFIASDEMAGRNTPSKELDITAKFLALNLSRWGFKPAGNDQTFLQKYSLKRRQVSPDKTTASISTTQLKVGEDFVPSVVGGKASGAIVYVGHGRVLKSKNIDAYKGIDVKDKILLVADGIPAGVTNADFRKGKLGVDFDFAATYAGRHGAKGIIYIPSKNFLEQWKDRYSRTLNFSQWQPDFRKGDKRVPTITVTASVADMLLQGEKVDYKVVAEQIQSGNFSESFALNSNKVASFDVSVNEESIDTQNVVGILEGSDPVLKNEYVAVGAHYDHVGLCAPVGSDNICNGADDDGSGTAAVLAIAEAMSHGPKPKRSILFVWHSGEEKGLWGSEYIAENPPVPLSTIIAQFNIDMIGRSRKADDMNPRNAGLTGPDEIYIIGSKMMSSRLAELSESVNKSYLNLGFNYKYDDPNDTERLFYRSDHFNYAKKGIPIIFYFDGIHEDYHRATDSVDKIDFKKMEKVTRTVLATVWKSANLPTRFVVDKPLPEQLQ